MSKKLPITKSGYSNAVGVNFFKSLLVVDIVFAILQEFRHIFLKKDLRKSGQATCTCFNIMALHSSSHQRCSITVVILKKFAVFTGNTLRVSI